MRGHIVMKGYVKNPEATQEAGAYLQGGGLTVSVDLPWGQPDRARRAGLAVTGRDLPLPGGS